MNVAWMFLSLQLRMRNMCVPPEFSNVVLSVEEIHSHITVTWTPAYVSRGDLLIDQGLRRPRKVSCDSNNAMRVMGRPK